jgi:vitamin B12 transporter
LTVGADLRLVSDSFDDPGNFVRLDGYPLATLRASLPLAERLELFGRIENVTDEEYETAAGYGTQGRSAFAGVRLRM